MKSIDKRSLKINYALGSLAVIILILQALQIYFGKSADVIISYVGWGLNLYFLFLIFRIRKIRTSIWGRIILIFCGAFLIGVLFKITHWTWANEILITAVSVIAVLYLVKKILDRSESIIYRFIKVIYVLSSFSYLVLSLLYDKGWHILFLANRVCLIILIILFVSNKGKAVKILETANSTI